MCCELMKTLVSFTQTIKEEVFKEIKFLYRDGAWHAFSAVSFAD